MCHRAARFTLGAGFPSPSAQISDAIVHPAVALTADEVLESFPATPAAASDTFPRRCPSCVGRKHRSGPLHSRIPGVCRFPHYETCGAIQQTNEVCAQHILSTFGVQTAEWSPWRREKEVLEHPQAAMLAILELLQHEMPAFFNGLAPPPPILWVRRQQNPWAQQAPVPPPWAMHQHR